MSEIKRAQHGRHSPAMRRRDWLRGLTGAFFALSLGSPLGMRQSWSQPPDLKDWLHSTDPYFLANRAALTQLGAVYLAMHPDERNFRRLSRLLSGAGSKPVRVHLFESIAQDWVEHDVTVVEGWVLARTEARICAALHLMGGIRA
jgi:hypothetical protein